MSSSCNFFSLQVFSQLQSVLGGASVSLHLVEVSPALSLLQAQNLTGNRSQEADAEDDLVYRRGETEAGLPVSWYCRLDDVPTGTPEQKAGCGRTGLYGTTPCHKIREPEDVSRVFPG